MGSWFRRAVKTAFSPKYLFWTNTSLGMTFLCAGDAIQQKVVQPRMVRYLNKETHGDELPVKPLDWDRSRAMLGGGVFFGSVGHFWYKFLDSKFVGNSRKAIRNKLIAEFLIGVPLGFGSFLVVGFLEGKPAKENAKNFFNNIHLICLGDWGFYVPLQYFNFYYLPPQYRVLFVACITLVYDTFFSYLLHREEDDAVGNNADKRLTKELSTTSSSASTSSKSSSLLEVAS